MVQISARMPENLVEELDAAARRLNCSRAEVLRRAAEAYLDDHEDLRIALERLEDSSDAVLDWDGVRCELDASEEVKRLGRSAVLRQAAEAYLRSRDQERIAEQYKLAYAQEPGLGSEFEDWEDQGEWPES